ncbi:MAG: hypothetical protein IH594_08175 [Bacteroidales bacterium]|nr:hypothetical protein [Bacteroidales bacterium]
MKKLLLLLILCIGLISCTSTPEKSGQFFKSAQPIWPEGQQHVKNQTVGFRVNFEDPGEAPVVLKITGSNIYRIFLNGQFLGHGPARAGHGHYRVDEWDLTDQVGEGPNLLAIEAVCYNVNSFYLLDQPAFVQAEIVAGNKVLAATRTNKNDFEVIILSERVQKVPRYSFQRPFVEYYRLAPGFDDWKTDPATLVQGVTCEYTGEKNLLDRHITYSEFDIRTPARVISGGKMKTGIKREKYWRDRAVTNIDEKLKGFPEEELVFNPAIALQEMEILETISMDEEYMKQTKQNLSAGNFSTLDFGTNLSGFIGATVTCTETARIYFTFDEILTGDDVDFRRLGCINAVTWDLEPGTYKLESIEPYTFKYLKIITEEGECSVEDVYIREYVNSDISKAQFVSSDPRLNRIYEAGVETFRQNAVDVFMDCPHRERAGWLCDSYFTARVAQDLSGNSLIERNFYENYLVPDSFQFIPRGMLPMCYPSDHNDGVFIPNWAMWFVVELKEYLYRSNDREMVDALKPRVMELLEYFDAFKNEDGLLEKLDSWVFVEWSAANGFVQDVNYPSNMLFAAVLDAAGDLYTMDELKKEAETIRETIRKQSFNGEFFVDNAIRNENGSLMVTNNTTEVCQYYAFFFDVAIPETHPELWKKLTEEFGPRRQQNNPYPNVHFANAFIGNYLRLELLSRYDRQAQLLSESIEFFNYMAERTGTLWENITDNASCNHGFASHVVHALYRDVLGIADVDNNRKVIKLIFSDLDIASCKGQIPLGDKLIKIEWERDETSIRYKCDAPEGFTVEVRNNSVLKLINNS